MSSFSFQHIEYFIEVCRYRSISGAASHLFISQQALSRSIRGLEKQLGYALLERTSKGILMTEAGSRLYKTFLPIVLSYKEAERQILSQASGNSSRVMSVSVAQGIIKSLSPEVFLGFGKLYPDLKLDTIEMTDKQIEQYIHEDSRRFGLVFSPTWIHTKKHNSIYLMTEPAWLLVHTSNPLSRLKTVSLAALKNECVLALSKSTYYQEALNKAVAPFNFSITPYFESNDMHDLLSMVNRGIGVVLCTKRIVEEVTLNDAVLVPVSERSFDCLISFIFQEFSALDFLSQEFIRFVQKSVEQNQSFSTPALYEMKELSS